MTASPIVLLPSIGLMGDRAAARAAIRDFLLTRRARITPAQAGLQTYGSNRRVKGLRREEVAMLAGISAEYYTRLERGDATGASPSVIEPSQPHSNSARPNANTWPTWSRQWTRNSGPAALLASDPDRPRCGPP